MRRRCTFCIVHLWESRRQVVVVVILGVIRRVVLRERSCGTQRSSRNSTRGLRIVYEQLKDFESDS